MFTKLKYGRWGYMVMTAIATIALAALATLLTAHSSGTNDHRAHHGNEQIINHIPHAQSNVRYIN